MVKVENKCTNCRHFPECQTVVNNRAVIWKHCDKFKPSLEAIEEARELEMKERRKKIALEFIRR